MSMLTLNLDHVRREVSSEFGLTIDPNDPVLVAAALAVMATRQLLAEERAKRADENLLPFGDVRTALEEVRDSAVIASQDLVAVTLANACKEILNRFDSEFVAEIVTRYRLRSGALVLVGSIIGGITTVTLMQIF